MADTAESAVHARSRWFWRGKVFSRIVFVVLGLFLVVTALLKLQGPADGALGQNTIRFSPRLQFAVVEIEALLGLWLLSGWAKRSAWFFAATFFLIVAGVSLYLGLMGQSSCGCFGRIQVSPWSAFTLDVSCLALLGLCRPSSRRGSEEVESVAKSRVRDALTIAGGACALWVVCWGGILLAGGSRAGDLLARVRGERISVEPPITDMGPDVAGQMHRFTVHLHNHTDHTVRIVGGTTSCACFVTDDLPVSIPPGGSVPVTILAGFKGTPGLFQEQFIFYADDKEHNRISARYQGRIVSHRDDKTKTALKEQAD